MFDLVVGVSRVRCLLECCWLGCRSRFGRGRGRAGSLSLLQSISFRGVFRCGKPGHVAREVVVVSVGFVWLEVSVEVVLPSLGWSSFV